MIKEFGSIVKVPWDQIFYYGCYQFDDLFTVFILNQ